MIALDSYHLSRIYRCVKSDSICFRCKEVDVEMWIYKMDM
jgi:hypothetical protein